MSNRYTHGSAALRMEAAEQQSYQGRPRFDLIEGAGQDAQAHTGVSATFKAVAHVALAAGLVFALLGSLRVALTVMTCDVLNANSGLRQEIRAAKLLEDDLASQVSSLSSSERITRIATQNLGMVPAYDSEQLILMPGLNGLDEPLNSQQN